MLIVVEKHVVSSDCVYGGRKTTGLLDVYTGYFQCSIDNIQYTVIWVNGHVYYRGGKSNQPQWYVHPTNAALCTQFASSVC